MQPNINNCVEQFAGTSNDAGWYPGSDDLSYQLNGCPSDSGVGGSSSSSETSSASKEVVVKSKPNPAPELPSNIPWALNRVYVHSVEGLHIEIVDCANWLKSTPQEVYARVNVCHRVKGILRNFWRDSTLRVFGSVATDLFLPTSDIDLSVDLTIVNPETMQCAATCFENSGDFDDVHVLDKAYVPIIKLRDRSTGIHVDISFNTQRAQEAVDYINHFRSLYPALEPITMFLKQLLMLRNLNHAFTGGLSSYGLVLMVAHLILRRYGSEFYGVQVNDLQKFLLGQFLLEFLKFYGEEFDPITEGLAFETPFVAKIVPKAELVLDMREAVCASIFCLQDPLLRSNDVGRGAHQYMLVRSYFKAVYDYLLADMNDNAFSKPMLSTMMQFPPEIVAVRAQMHTSAVETWMQRHPNASEFADGLSSMPALAGITFSFPTMQCIVNAMNYRGFNGTPEETICDAIVQREMLMQQMYENPSQYGVDFNAMKQLTHGFVNSNFPSPMQPPMPLQQQYLPPNFMPPQYFPPGPPFLPHHVPVIPPPPPPHHPQAFVHQIPVHPIPQPMYHPNQQGRFLPEVVPFFPPPHMVVNYGPPGFEQHHPIPGFPYGYPFLPPVYYVSSSFSQSLPRVTNESESSTGSNAILNSEEMACQNETSLPESMGSGTSGLSSISPNFDDVSPEALSSAPLTPGLSD